MKFRIVKAALSDNASLALSWGVETHCVTLSLQVNSAQDLLLLAEHLHLDIDQIRVFVPEVYRIDSVWTEWAGGCAEYTQSYPGAELFPDISRAKDSLRQIKRHSCGGFDSNETVEHRIEKLDKGAWFPLQSLRDVPEVLGVCRSLEVKTE